MAYSKNALQIRPLEHPFMDPGECHLVNLVFLGLGYAKILIKIRLIADHNRSGRKSITYVFGPRYKV
jgi:hypothetical protein